MQISFNANLENGEAEISPATLRDLAAMPPLLRADILKDIVFNATKAYNAALIAMQLQWETQRNGQASD